MQTCFITAMPRWECLKLINKTYIDASVMSTHYLSLRADFSTNTVLIFSYRLPFVLKTVKSGLVLTDIQALESPQEPSLILQCKDSVVKKPIWLSNNNIALLQKDVDRWKLISYSISKNKSTDLYNLKDGNLVDFTYSVSDDLIAVISIHNDGQHYIEMLKPDGRILSSHQIERPQEIPKFRSIYPNFDPLNKQLIFSTGRQLFTLSYEGKIAKISLPFADKMGQPEFHPDGKKLLLIKGPYDSDIVLLPLNQIVEADPLAQSNKTQLQQAKAYSSFERSNLGEDYAIFQPAGELIAFWSQRS
jgi:transcriptional activator of cad operon